ncbi:STAS domain-containing protein [Actinoplanes sp. CA-030573]|uniref:STAS domain-containing protein n=1 Tax=Actinoplanes sp. CA-030573 TaxID=3239898 RepID=UPI003D8B61C3
MQAVSIGPEVDGTLTISLRGEVDFTNAEGAAAVIRGALAERHPRAVCVDVAEVSFLDSSGIGVLVNAMQAAEDISAGFRVENPRYKIFDQLRMSGLLDSFGLAEAPPG